MKGKNNTNDYKRIPTHEQNSSTRTLPQTLNNINISNNNSTIDILLGHRFFFVHSMPNNMSFIFPNRYVYACARNR